MKFLTCLEREKIWKKTAKKEQRRYDEVSDVSREKIQRKIAERRTVKVTNTMKFLVGLERDK